ncbi:MAG: hypothetical protein AAF636_25190 [Pseudomonadota bacterium]
MNSIEDSNRDEMLHQLAMKLGGEVSIETFGVYFRASASADDQFIGKTHSLAVESLEKKLRRREFGKSPRK